MSCSNTTIVGKYSDDGLNETTQRAFRPLPSGVPWYDIANELAKGNHDIRNQLLDVAELVLSQIGWRDTIGLIYDSATRLPIDIDDDRVQAVADMFICVLLCNYNNLPLEIFPRLISDVLNFYHGYHSLQIQLQRRISNLWVLKHYLPYLTDNTPMPGINGLRVIDAEYYALDKIHGVELSQLFRHTIRSLFRRYDEQIKYYKAYYIMLYPTAVYSDMFKFVIAELCGEFAMERWQSSMTLPKIGLRNKRRRNSTFMRRWTINKVMVRRILPKNYTVQACSCNDNCTRAMLELHVINGLMTTFKEESSILKRLKLWELLSARFKKQYLAFVEQYLEHQYIDPKLLHPVTVVRYLELLLFLEPYEVVKAYMNKYVTNVYFETSKNAGDNTHTHPHDYCFENTWNPMTSLGNCSRIYGKTDRKSITAIESHTGHNVPIKFEELLEVSTTGTEDYSQPHPETTMMNLECAICFKYELPLLGNASYAKDVICNCPDTLIVSDDVSIPQAKDELRPTICKCHWQYESFTSAMGWMVLESRSFPPVMLLIRDIINEGSIVLYNTILCVTDHARIPLQSIKSVDGFLVLYQSLSKASAEYMKKYLALSAINSFPCFKALIGKYTSRRILASLEPRGVLFYLLMREFHPTLMEGTTSEFYATGPWLVLDPAGFTTLPRLTVAGASFLSEATGLNIVSRMNEYNQTGKKRRYLSAAFGSITLHDDMDSVEIQVSPLVALVSAIVVRFGTRLNEVATSLNSEFYPIGISMDSLLVRLNDYIIYNVHHRSIVNVLCQPLVHINHDGMVFVRRFRYVSDRKKLTIPHYRLPRNDIIKAVSDNDVRAEAQVVKYLKQAREAPIKFLTTFCPEHTIDRLLSRYIIFKKSSTILCFDEPLRD